jgi:hypothetical protein
VSYPSSMPLIVLAAVLLLLLLVSAVLLPLSLVQRYRVGTARRPARGWVAAITLTGFLLSSVIFLLGAAIANVWVPNALAYSLAGMAAGCALGVLGLWTSRWERSSRGLHYTPNRWLVLAITLVVTARLVYGFWRGWHAWRARLDDTSWLVAAGAAGSLAAGALVLGYYVTYWAGVRGRIRRHREREARPFIGD